MSLSNEVKLLLRYMNVENDKHHPRGSRSVLSKKLDWQKVLRLARQNEIAALFYHNLQKTGIEDRIPTPIRHEFEKSYFGVNFQNICYFEELKRILLLFSNSGIEVIILKGMALANTIYRNAALRPMKDIDILVKKQDVDHAEMLLTRKGYLIDERHPPQQWYRDNCHHLAPFHNPHSGIYIEVHHDLLPPRKAIHLEIDHMWQRARTERIDGIDAKILCAEDMLIHLCLHLLGFGSTCVGRIKHLVDIAQYLRYVNEDLDWDMLEKEACKNRFVDYIYYSLYSARNLLGAKIDGQTLTRFKRKSSKNFAEDYLLKRAIARKIIYDDAFHLFPRGYHGKIFALLLIEAPIQEKLKSLLGFIFPHNSVPTPDDSNGGASKISKAIRHICRLLSLISKFTHNAVLCVLNRLSEKDNLS